MIFADGKHSRLCFGCKPATSEVLANAYSRRPSTLRSCLSRFFRILAVILFSSLESVPKHLDPEMYKKLGRTA